MQSTDWAPEHSDALREYHARRLSFAEIADAINAKFKTAYFRNATIGRATRMGLAGPDRPGGPDRREDLPTHWPGLSSNAKAPGLRKPRERYQPEFMRPMPVFERAEPAKLRCVEIVPRHLTLIDLEPRRLPLSLRRRRGG